MKKALFPGSFDPFHKGHLSIYKKSLKLFDEVIIYITFNYDKKNQLSLELRKKSILKIIPEAKIICGKELTAEISKKNNINFLVRGLRSNQDIEYEINMASINKTINKSLETIWFIADEHLKDISSSQIKYLKNKIIKNN